MDQKLLKITCHLEAKKISAYFKMPLGQDSTKLQNDIETYLFEERKLPRCEIRLYWIDSDQDEIDIINQRDFEIFLVQYPDAQQLHVAPVGNATEDKTTKKEQDANDSSQKSDTSQYQIPPAANNDESRVHTNVECDSCLMAPIVGFRYKCIQCPNYDLCQNCEIKQVHAEHMMVRLPNNDCPHVIDYFITNGRKLSRKHEKRCKSGGVTVDGHFPCNFAFASTSSGGSPAMGNGDKSCKEGKVNGVDVSAETMGKERHHYGRRHRRHVRHNFLSHLYEMMHDLAEGGGAAAAAAAMGTSGDVDKNAGSTTSNVENGKNASNDAAAVAVENAQEVAKKAAEIASKAAQQATLTAAAAAAVAAAATGNTVVKDNNGENAEKDSTSFKAPQQPTASEISVTPSLENLAQFLNPHYMKTGIEILNNFSDMFAKMLDPVDTEDSPSSSTSCPFESMMRKTSNASQQSATSKKSNESQESKQNEAQTLNNVKPEATEDNPKKSSTNSLVDITDLGSDTESDDVEDFVQLNVPTKENTPEKEATPTQSLNKSNVMDFAQLSADLKAHIAQEQQANDGKPSAEKESKKPNESEQKAPERELRAVPVFKTKTLNANAATAAQPKNPENERNVPIYHTDERINRSVHAMMSMGFANEGAMLTQLLESVNGNISEAIDVILATQR